MMQSLYKNPASFPESTIEIESEARIGFYLSKTKQEKISLHYVLKEGASLSFTLVDIEDSNLNFDITIDMKENSSAHIYLATLDLKDRNKTFSVFVNHLEKNTYSRTSMAGINAGKGSLKLLGSSYIKNGAHKSDTRQEGKITNLSPDAKSEVSPALLIKENDVNASHGAALGAYNDQELYYLMSRGLSQDESKKLITYGSLLPILETLNDEEAMNEFKNTLGDLSL